MEEMKRPNSKATKSELADYISKLEDVIKESVEEVEDLKTTNEKLRKQKVVSGVESGIGTASTLGEIAKTLADRLATAEEDLIGAKEEYTNVKEAVELKEAELKELFDIEKNAYTLSAIVAGQKKSKEEFEEEKAEILAKHQADLDALREEIKLTREAELKREAEYDSELRKTRDREEHDYKYNFDRKKKEEEDALTDKLNKLTRAHQEKIAADKLEVSKLRAELEEDQEAFDGRVEDYDKYKEAFETRAEDIKSAVEVAVDDAKKQVTKNYEIKIGYIERANKKDVEMKESEIATLRESIDRLKKEKEELGVQVKESYEKLQNIALASVSGDKYKEAMGAMANAMPKAQA